MKWLSILVLCLALLSVQARRQGGKKDMNPAKGNSAKDMPMSGPGKGKNMNPPPGLPSGNPGRPTQTPVRSTTTSAMASMTTTASHLPPIYVANGGCNGANFAQTIQEAFDEAQDGQTVVLCPGTYTARAPIPTLNGRIHLRGALTSSSRRSTIVGRVLLNGGAQGTTINNVDFASDDELPASDSSSPKEQKFILYIQAGRVEVTNGTFTTGPRSEYAINVSPAVDGVTIRYNNFTQSDPTDGGIAVLFRNPDDVGFGNDDNYARHSTFLIEQNTFFVNTPIFAIAAMSGLVARNNNASLTGSGPIFYYMSCGCSIFNTTITDNHVNNNGGGAEAYFVSATDGLSFTNVSITGNVVDLNSTNNDGIIFEFSIPTEDFNVTGNTASGAQGLVLMGGRTFGPSLMTQNKFQITNSDGPYFVSYPDSNSPLLDSVRIYNNDFTFAVTSRTVNPSVYDPDETFRMAQTAGSSQTGPNTIRKAVV